MLHITVGMLIILLVATAVFAISIGQAAERRAAAKRQKQVEKEVLREQARLNRRASWEARKRTVTRLLPWKRSS
jgi:hypothetical protein